MPPVPRVYLALFIFIYLYIYTLGIFVVIIVLTMMTTNFWCFMVKNINISIWERMLNKICIGGKTNSKINYILISLKGHNRIIMGYIQCSLAIDDIQTYLLNIIGVHDIDSWEEANKLKHLSLCHTLIHSLILHDAQLYYEHSNATSTLNNKM